MQRKLSDFEVQNLERARSAILAINWAGSSEGDLYWSEIYGSLCEKIRHGTSDGKPLVEPELTDEDACVWPRRLVMVRDNDYDPWLGPYRYLGKTGRYCSPFVVDGTDRQISRAWKHARRATAEEIKEAGL